MFGSLKMFWKAISTGWVLEYPGEEPSDFFDNKDRVPQWVKPAKVENELERYSYPGEGKE
jgi:hypothetical protein